MSEHIDPGEHIDLHMMEKSELYKRVSDPADPERCQANTSQGQCPMRSIPGLQVCRLHCGQSEAAQKKRSMNQYRLGRWQARVQELRDSDQVKSLRDEIGITRMLLEERFQKCQDSTSLMLESHNISELVLKIERLVSACHKIEKSMGDLIDKSDIIRLTDQFIAVIEDVLTDQPEKVKLISKQFEDIITSSDGEDDDDD